MIAIWRCATYTYGLEGAVAGLGADTRLRRTQIPQQSRAGHLRQKCIVLGMTSIPATRW